MKRLCAGLAALTAFLVLSVPALGWGGPDPNPIAKANCDNAFHNQDGSAVEAGGGPKIGQTGPLNCDHYWQRHDYIGNGEPPGPPGP